MSSNTIKISNENLYYFINNQNNQKKILAFKIYSHFKFWLIFIFLILFYESYEKGEIKLVIKQGGEFNYLNPKFYKSPSNYSITYLDPCNVTIKFDSWIESCANMLEGLTDIIEIDLSKFDTSKETTMESMFNGCSNLEKIIFGNINTSLVENMEYVFYNCIKLVSIDVSNFNTSSVTSMQGMFAYCKSLISINLSSFNTQNVENIRDLFGYCDELSFIYGIDFDTKKVQKMQGIFFRNYKLQSIDLSSFNSSLVTNMDYIFGYCNSLIYLNLYSFIIKNGIPITNILKDTPSNIKICINDLNTRNILASYKKTFDCSDDCLNRKLKIDSQYKRCVENCNESNYKYENNNTCYNKCPSETYTKENEYLCLAQKPEGYYLDLNDLKYKKCFDRCKNCYEFGNEINNKEMK